MPSCPMQESRSRLVDLKEVVQAAVRISGVSKERFDMVDNLPPSELFVTIGEGAEVRDVVVPCVAAKWNSSLSDVGGGLRASRVCFDPANAHGIRPTAGCQLGGALLVRRGECSLGDKAVHAAESGAGAVLVCDTEPGRHPGCMTAGGARPTIPGFMIPAEFGSELQEALLADRSVRITAASLRPPRFIEMLGGEDPIRKLVTTFYRHVFSDPEAWFRDIFHGREEAMAVENLAAFLIERWGGPDYFSRQKGPAQLIPRHMGYDIKRGSAERWLMHMEAAIAELGALFGAEARDLLRDYFRYQAHFIGYSYLASRGEVGPDNDTSELTDGCSARDAADGCCAGGLAADGCKGSAASHGAAELLRDSRFGALLRRIWVLPGTWGLLLAVLLPGCAFLRLGARPRY